MLWQVRPNLHLCSAMVKHFSLDQTHPLLVFWKHSTLQQVHLWMDFGVTKALTLTVWVWLLIIQQDVHHWRSQQAQTRQLLVIHLTRIHQQMYLKIKLRQSLQIIHPVKRKPINRTTCYHRIRLQQSQHTIHQVKSK